VDELTLPTLEKVCGKCGGCGGEFDRRDWFPCCECKGKGYFPTEAGRRILVLMRHNLPAMSRDDGNVLEILSNLGN